MDDLLDSLNDLFDSWSDLINRNGFGQSLENDFTPSGILYTVWFPGIVILVILFFFYRKQWSIGGIILAILAVFYATEFVIPKLSSGWAGIAPFGFLLILTAMVVIYFTLIRSD
jgi:hypothetical protein